MAVTTLSHFVVCLEMAQEFSEKSGAPVEAAAVSLVVLTALIY
jgi:hypothetical protein